MTRHDGGFRHWVCSIWGHRAISVAIETPGAEGGYYHKTGVLVCARCLDSSQMAVFAKSMREPWVDSARRTVAVTLQGPLGFRLYDEAPLKGRHI